ncbi:phosphonate ABC transporter, permease protein PhnE [Asticcacaulis excentricus]|uniref:Phosphonate ABC transporter, inner membrane subunit n=1 Tax=Asticcacaulis excentricus (strain ATCC 15261 / DSM 4724 / KCTC 12464 / NCIMB 9791 / VKM B-1370 / CB 48) TaxID=573065 RepID=E8RPC6_ASTEC|nr:phosphonate ABC transporter, permease protein PhnE [Asticcacaulis excentricus]ADU11972.1 phosphonate ABC transporter, inner membrane subunit [Asticcacaulis excentricus CB 48]
MVHPSSPEALQPPRASLPEKLLSWGLWLGFGLLLALSFKGAQIGNLPLLGRNWDNTSTYLRDYLHPDLSDLSTVAYYMREMWVTVQVAIWGTVLSIILAIPFSLLCATNIAPSWISFPVRRLMDTLRAVNELVIGTAFLVAVGPGPLAGVLALALHNTGVLAKLFSEAVEAVDQPPIEGVRATGGTRLQEIVWGILPQVGPLWTSFALYRFESSARSATVLGLIGAGGIGQVLFDNINSFNYARVSAIALIIVAAVVLIDLTSATLRKRLV